LPREHLEIEVASIVQANPVDNVNVTDIIQVAVPSIVQTNSVDNGNVSVTGVNVNVDDRSDGEMGQSDCDTVDETIKLPHCVSLTSWNSWRESRKWLVADNHKVRCNICSEVLRQGLGTLKALAGPRASSKLNLGFAKGVTTDHIKKGRNDRKKKLLKKIDKHSKSITHRLCVRIQNDAGKCEIEVLTQKANTVWEEANAEKIDATCKIFRTAYMCCKEELAFTKHTSIVQLQELNHSAKYSMLYSDHSCANILKHIADHMKGELNAYIVATNYPFSILVDETTTLSTKSALIVYVRIQVQNEVCNFFYDLVDLLHGSTGIEIANAVIGCFSSLTGNTEDDLEKSKNILRSRLIGFASDGASVMVGEYNGAVVKLQEMLNTNFKAFHCLAHRLELAVHSAVRSSGEIERLQLFTDSLYTFYHRSYKNMNELYAVAENLHSQLLRVVRSSPYVGFFRHTLERISDYQHSSVA